jgi:hypothetical protein
MGVGLVGNIMSVIVFFSNSNELEILKKRSDFNKIKLVALTPEADFSLIDLPDRRKTIEDYYDEKKLNIIGNSSLEKVDQICKSIDQKFFQGNLFFSCSDVYMYVKLLYDQLLINHTFCNSILHTENPEKIILLNKKELSEEFMLRSYDDLLINFIHYFFFECNGIPVEFLSFNKKKKPNLFNFKKIKKVLKSFVSEFKFNIISVFFRIKNRNNKSICIIQHYDFSAAKKNREFFKTFFLKDNLRYFKIKSVEKKDISSVNKFFKIGTIDYFKLIERKIDNLINGVSVKFVQMVTMYSKWLLKIDAKAVIAASGQSLPILACIKAAKLNRIPVIWGQHGGFYGYGEFPIMKYLHKNYSHYFLYSEGCFSVNNGINCFVVSDTKLRSLYQYERKL